MPLPLARFNDPALSTITDEVTLMKEPAVTPSPVDTTDSLVEAGRNLEYFIQRDRKSFHGLILTLSLRRWEKNFQKRYDRLTAAADSKSAFYIKQVKQEISKIRAWMKSKDSNIKSDKVSIQLFSVLKRYENNLLQLSRNLDAFYIKRKKMLKSAGTLDRSIQMIKEKRFGTATETEIDGLYYLSPKMPTHGQPRGNFHDVGTLVRNPPSGYGYRHCKNWMQFYFDKDGRYTKENFISSIYFHVWIRTVNNNIDVGYDKEGRYSGGRGGMDGFVSIKYDNSKGYSTVNGCSLITGKIDMNYSITGEDIYKLVIKLSRHSNYPSVVMEPKQYSFIIINPPGDTILKSQDIDNDGLNDYEEMFTYFTNPQDYDTDSDGLSDSAEVVKGTSPNSNDLYSGGVIPGINDTPHIKHYKSIEGDWIVDKEERHADTKFAIAGNLIIRGSGLLILDNCIVELNRGVKNRRAYVDKGGTLIVNNSEIIVCEDEDSESPSLVILAGSHPVVSNSRFNMKRVKQDATSSIIFD